MSEGKEPRETPGMWRAIWVGAASVVLGSAIWGALTALGAHVTVHIH